MTRPHSPKAKSTDNWDSRNQAGGSPSFPAGERSVDFTAFLALVKEAGRFLGSFSPPKHFRPEPPAPPQPLDPEMIRDLGAASLDDFFALAQGGQPEAASARGGRVAELFPQGPESIRGAMSALEAEIKRLSRELETVDQGWSPSRPGYESRVRPLENLINEFKQSRANLVRVARIWPRMKAEALDWPRGAKQLWQKARRFEEVVAALVKAARGNAEDREADPVPGREGRERRSLTKATSELRAEVESARAVLADGARWADSLEALLTDLDNLLALVVDGSQADRDWRAVARKLTGRLSDLEREERRLKDESARVSESLTMSLGALTDTEASLAGREGGELLERIENVGRGTLALWRSTIERRREMGRVYFFLPARIGRPVYLEKSFLASALTLGRTQALLEDLRHQLSLVGGRLSTTHRLRGEGEGLVERLALPQQRASRLKLARRRLASLTRAVDQRVSLAEVRDELDQVRRLGRDTHREMVRGRSENNRMRKELSAAALEKERLQEQLNSTRQGLGEVGLMKARLLKIYNSKTELLNSVELERRRLTAENEGLKADRTELRRKRSRLADLYAGQRAELKRINAELREHKSELVSARDELTGARDELGLARAELTDARTELSGLREEQGRSAAELAGARDELARARDELTRNQTLLEERRELENLLDQTRLERDDLDVRRREVEDQLKNNVQALAASTAKAESLAAELGRHQEELTEANRLRLAMGEKVAVLRRRLDLVAQAHESLLKTLRRKDSQLAGAETERRDLSDKLTRQKKNILRLVAVRQELRAELGAARLKLSDLETERDGIYAQLEAARKEAQDSAQAKDALAAQLAGLEEDRGRLAGQLGDLQAKVTDDLTPFIRILGEALWQSEAQLKQARSSSDGLLEQFKLDADVREANMRLKAASREIEITEAAETNRRILEDNLFERENELAEAEARLAEVGEKAQDLEQEREALAVHNRELSETISRLDGRTQKLRSALDTLKRRYGDRMDEARLAADDLKGLLERQGREMEDQKARLARLEPLIDHFFNEAARALPAAEQAGDQELAAFLKSESRSLIADGEPGAAEGPALDERLAAKLTELQPMVSFLAKSFVANVSELAQARDERGELLKQLEEARGRQAALADDMSLTSGTQSGLLAELAEARDQQTALADELARSREDQEFLSNQLAQAASTRAVLESSLQHRETELVELRSEAFTLAQDREQLQNALAEKESALAEKTEEAATLKSELAQADRDLAENDGRLEASWAALNYLGTRASDRLGEMKNRLDTQARQVDSLSLELKRRETHIKDLEDRQDKLALLYWTLISKAVTAGPGAVTLSLPAPAELQADADESLKTIDGQEDQAKNSGGHGLGKGLLEGVKKVARRSLFTLIMAGGLIMAGSLPAAAEAAADTAREHGGGMMIPYQPPSSPEGPHLVSRLDSNYIGRAVGLELVESGPRLAGRPAVEKRLAEMVENLAASQGLTNGEFLRLLRVARGPESTVHLADFEGRAGGLALLEPHFPKMTRHLRAWSEDLLTSRRLTALMRSAADFKPAEGGFWERLFFDFLSGRKPELALESLLDHLAQKKQAAGVRPEYAGRLAPMTELENMGPDTFIKFMTGHIKSHWPNDDGRIRDLAAKRLAGDLYFSARLFKLPLTFVAALTHQQAEDGEDFFRRGSTYAIHTLTADLAALTRESGLLWQEGRPPLCDLDEVLAAGDGPAFIEEVYRKKMSLVMAYNKTMNADNTLLPDLRRRAPGLRRLPGRFAG